jgi:hypothetical protein
VMASFPSVYQLMPPDMVRYLEVARGEFVNPLDTSELVVPIGMKVAAARAHKAIEQSIRSLAPNKVRVIRGIGRNTDDKYKVYRQGDRYELLRPVPSSAASGDGTVTIDSASFQGHYQKPNDVIEVQDVEHAFMCNSARVAAAVRKELYLL